MNQSGLVGDGASPAECDRFTIPVADALLVLVCAAVFAGWAATASGTFSFLAAFILTVICGTSYLAGALILNLAGVRRGLLIDFPLRFLAGYMAVNTALFAAVWISPLSIEFNFGILVVAVVAGILTARPRFTRDLAAQAGPAMIATVVALAAATLWAQDSLRYMEAVGDVTVFKPWLDGFYHAAHVRLFSVDHGSIGIEDFRLTGVPARPYHYASYMIPALVKAVSGLPAYAGFAGLLVPIGVFLTGLAAYALVASWWGGWPGLLATGALLLLPDGAQQGGGNTFLGYHWMQMVGPGGMYAIVLLTLAWLFVLRGCAGGSFLQVAAGWLSAALAVTFKAQFFVAAAFLLWMFPPAFMVGLVPRRRWLWSGLALAIFLVAAVVAGGLPALPVLRLDGSSTAAFLSLVDTFAPPGLLKAILSPWLDPAAPWPGRIGFGALYLLVSTLGVLVLAYPVLATWKRHEIALPLRVLPALVWANFLVMALGLALDDRGVGTPEELLHRPFVWFYFMTAAWVGGAAGLAIFSAPPRARLATRLAVVGGALVLLAVPAWFGSGVQRLKAMPLSDLTAPSAAVRATEFVRLHADPDDLVQDSSYDGLYVVTALSERRSFVIASRVQVTYGLAEIRRRVAVVERFKALTSEQLIAETARRLQIRWFILERGDRVGWPQAIVGRPVFEEDGFRVFRLY
jgi:hypothetical protein